MLFTKAMLQAEPEPQAATQTLWLPLNSQLKIPVPRQHAHVAVVQVVQLLTHPTFSQVLSVAANAGVGATIE